MVMMMNLHKTFCNSIKPSSYTYSRELWYHALSSICFINTLDVEGHSNKGHWFLNVTSLCLNGNNHGYYFQTIAQSQEFM